MKMFIFEDVNQVSDNYHSEGGLAVVAKDKEHVYQLIEEYGDIEITEDEWQKAWFYELVDNADPRVFVFPDAGCC